MDARALSAIAGLLRGAGNAGKTLWERGQVEKKNERQTAMDALKSKYMMAMADKMRTLGENTFMTSDELGAAGLGPGLKIRPSVYGSLSKRDLKKQEKEKQKYKDRIFNALLDIEKKYAEGKWDGSEEDYDNLKSDLLQSLEADNPVSLFKPKNLSPLQNQPSLLQNQPSFMENLKRHFGGYLK
jgi:hypothetical protein